MFKRLLAGITLSSAKWLIVKTHEVNSVKCIKRSLTKGHWWQMQLLHCGPGRSEKRMARMEEEEQLRLYQRCSSLPSMAKGFQQFFSIKELQGVSFRPLLTFLYIYVWIKFSQGFPDGLVGKESSCNARDYLQCGNPGFDPWLRRRKWQCTPVFLPGESHGQRSLAGYSPWSHKESDTTEVTEPVHKVQSFSMC